MGSFQLRVVGGATGGGFLRLRQPWKRAILKVSGQTGEFVGLLADRLVGGAVDELTSAFYHHYSTLVNSFLAIAIVLALVPVEAAIPRNRPEVHGVIRDLISPFSFKTETGFRVQPSGCLLSENKLKLEL